MHRRSAAIDSRVLDTRLAPVSVTRAEESDTGKIATLSGYAARFDQEIELRWWREKIAKGAFRNSIANDDPRGLLNHDTTLVLARQSAGTLSLSEDAEGLKFRMDLPDTSYARDLLAVVERGDLDGMSFGFEILREERQAPKDGELKALYTLTEVRLHEVSPVTFPAYDETSVSVATRDRRDAEAVPKAAPRRDTDVRLRMARLDDLEDSV